MPAILLIATVMRFYHLDFSFSNDELSALSRIQFNSVNELISYGVAVDAHPAFTQVFLYLWASIFDITELFIRLPFVLMGVVSVYLAFILGKLLFDEYSGLLTAAAMATLSFFILYSQLARPYSPGLLFVLASAIGWVKIIKGPPSNWNIAIAAIATSLAMYTHYFSFMTAGIIWLAVLPMLNRFNKKAFIIASLCTGLLFLPHIKLTLLQLSYGGVGSWLGPPTSDYWQKYLSYIFNDSMWLPWLYLLMLIVAIVLNHRYLFINKWHLFLISVFTLPFVIGYYYSVHINPVLQFSTLLFSTPFLFLFGFSFFNKYVNIKLIHVSIAILLLGGIYSTTIDEKFYEKEHFGVFRELAEKISEWDDKYGSDNITRVANVNSEYYLNYYLNRINHNTSFSSYYMHGDSALANFNKIIHQATTPFFAFCWSTLGVAPEAEEMIRLKFPKKIDTEEHFNSGISLYSSSDEDERTPLFETGNSLLNANAFFAQYSEDQLNNVDGITTYTLLPENEYSPTFEYTAESLNLIGGEIIVAKVVLIESEKSDVHLVLSIDSETQNEWHSTQLHPVFVNDSSLTQNLIICRHWPQEFPKSAKLKIYIWNRSGILLQIQDMRILIYSASVAEKN